MDLLSEKNKMEIEEIIRKLASYFACKKKASRVSAQKRKEKKLGWRKSNIRREFNATKVHNDQIFKALNREIKK